LQRECRINSANHGEQDLLEKAVENAECLIMLCLNNSASRLAALMPAMLQPHFWNFLGNNRILAGAAIVRAKWGAIAFGSFQSPG
jgi:hypothetical protein